MASLPPYENNVKLNLTNLRATERAKRRHYFKARKKSTTMWNWLRNFSNIDEFLSSKILKDCIQVQKKKERIFFPCVGHKTR